MNKIIIPPKVLAGDTIGIIAPSLSLSIIHEKWIEIAENYFYKKGLKVKYSKNCRNNWNGNGGTIKERVEDIHSMFLDKSVTCIICAIGGYNANQIIPYLDYDLIKSNPKILIGYSDITVLVNAIYTKTSLVTYIGPIFSTFGQPYPLEFTLKYFEKIALEGSYNIRYETTNSYCEDLWFLNIDDQKERNFSIGNDFEFIRKGLATGAIIGGNISTLNLLIGTEFLPNFNGKILFIEECDEDKAWIIDRQLTHLRQTGLLNSIQGLVVGRFQKESSFENNDSVKELVQRVTCGLNIPIAINFNFGHTEPFITLPIGINCRMDSEDNLIELIHSSI